VEGKAVMFVLSHSVPVDNHHGLPRDGFGNYGWILCDADTPLRKWIDLNVYNMLESPTFCRSYSLQPTTGWPDWLIHNK